MTLDPLLAAGAEFMRAEFVPTLAALAAAALREPMTWGVLAVALVARLLHRSLAHSR